MSWFLHLLYEIRWFEERDSLRICKNPKGFSDSDVHIYITLEYLMGIFESDLSFVYNSRIYNERNFIIDVQLKNDMIWSLYFYYILVVKSLYFYFILVMKLLYFYYILVMKSLYFYFISVMKCGETAVHVTLTISLDQNHPGRDQTLGNFSLQ